ncbi:hypothetical protein T08_3118, partial [Trichinella sp. T8]
TKHDETSSVYICRQVPGLRCKICRPDEGSIWRVSWNKILDYNEECGNQPTICDDDRTAIIEILKKFRLLIHVDIPLFGTLTDDKILEAVEEDVDMSKPLLLQRRLEVGGAQKEFSATQLMLM